ncbi:hypothetical protein H6P81_007271 [Aristolochia fimbriata]|uniref:RNase H type-1 domain-containing protein n=1 Tax=Aristolochia fimbriata TaxID=158543 RepID=A0AAV7F3J5_ARIFI|nr:hypothetical protein H6P81_007271 [Aristolochia fimbriata]
MSRPIFSGRLAKWVLLLSEFEINFMPHRAIKGQALANFLADHPIPAERELTEEFPDEEIFLFEILLPWKMYFDGAARRNGGGEGVLFVSPKDDLLPYSFVLTQNCSNYVAEYQALLLDLGMAMEMKIPQLKVYGDFVLVVKQITTNALAGIVASLAQFDNRPTRVPICERWVVPLPIKGKEDEVGSEEESFPISIGDRKSIDWRDPITNFLRHGALPADLRERAHIRRTTPRKVAKYCKKPMVEFAAHTKLARSSTHKSRGWDTIGRQCFEMPSRWHDPAKLVSSTPMTFISHQSHFTERLLLGRSKHWEWT